MESCLPSHLTEFKENIAPTFLLTICLQRRNKIPTNDSITASSLNSQINSTYAHTFLLPKLNVFVLSAIICYFFAAIYTNVKEKLGRSNEMTGA